MKKIERIQKSMSQVLYKKNTNHLLIKTKSCSSI